MDKPELTPRELEILTELAKGKSYQEIASEHHIARETVHKHLTLVYKKLKARNGIHAVAIAIQKGLIG